MSETALLLQDAPAILPPAEPQKGHYEPPTKGKRPKTGFIITRENAKELGAKGREIRRRMLELARNPPPALQEEPREAKIALAECDRLSLALEDKRLKPLERAELSKALDRMLDRVRIIRGQPAPGTVSSRASAAAPSTGAQMLAGSGSAATAAPDTTSAGRDEQE